MRRSMIPAAAVLVGLSAAPVLAQSAGQTIDVGGWKVTRVDNPDSTFKQCNASMTYDDNSTLAFAATAAKKVYIVVIEPDFKLTEKQVYKAKFSIDGKPAVPADAVASDATTLVIPVEDDGAFMPAAMAGNTLTIAAGGQTLDEPLTGSKDAINQLGQCAATGLKGG